MKYRKLFDWIDGDDACEATAVTLYSAHDPGHDGEQDFIIRRVKSLIETGVTIQSIELTVWRNNDTEYQLELDTAAKSLDAFINVIKNIYDDGESIEAMIIKVDIKEDGH